MDNRIRALFLLVISTVTVLTFFSSPLYSAESEDIIIENADTGELLLSEVDSQVLILSGRVHMHSGEQEIFADRLTLHADEQRIEAEGNVKFISPGQTIRAKKMRYDLKNSRGTILDHKDIMKPWYLSGKKMEQKDKTHFILLNTRVTTCDLAVPHYTLRAKKIKIHLDDKIQFYHLRAYVGKIPVFYLPYYSRPMKRPRVEFTFGTSGRQGIMTRTTIHYSFKPGSAGDAIVDYYSKKGMGFGIQQELTIKRKHHLFIDGYWIQERSDTFGKRGRLRMRSTHELPMGFRARSEIHWVSDADFRRHYFEDEFLSERAPRNFVSIEKSTSQFSISAQYAFRLNDFIQTQEKRPEIRYILYPLRIAKTKFYAEATADYLDIHDRSTAGVVHLKTANVRTKFYTQRKLFGFWSFTPFAGYEGHWYDRTPDTMRNVYQNIPFYGLDTTLRTRFAFGNPLKGRFKYFKNFADLSFGYEKHEAQNLKPEEIPPLGRGGSKLEILKWNLTQYVRGYTRERKSEHIFNLNMNTTYDLKKAFDRWSALRINSNFRPVPAWGFFTDVEYDPNERFVRYWNPGTDFRMGRHVAGKLGYIKRKDDTKKIILKDYRGNLTFDTLDKWKLGWRFEYDGREKVFSEVEYQMTRQMHKWELNMRHLWFPGRKEYKFYISLQLKDIPGAVLGYNKSFSLPRNEKPADIPMY